MRISVLVPVGPGHAEVAKEAMASALAENADCPDDWTIDGYLLDDTEGELGRAKARNMLAQSAILDNKEPPDWLFFLDADDLCFPSYLRVLENAVALVPELEAVWGEIWSERAYYGSDREIQLIELQRAQTCRAPLTELEEITDVDTAHGNFSVGMFIKPELFQRVGGWLEAWDLGEDHEFCYACCAHAKAFAKLNRRLVKIRNWMPSAVGKRGYGPADRRPLLPEEEQMSTYMDAWKLASTRASAVHCYWRDRGPEPWTDFEKELREEEKIYGV